jgi:hypothetical protein
MLGEPVPHGGMFVRSVGVGDQMQRLVPGRLAVDLLQELKPLGVGVSLLAWTDDLAVNTLSAANSVVVPLRLSSWVIVSARPFFSGRPGWVRSSAWHLTLLVAAQHQRVLRGYSHLILRSARIPNTRTGIPISSTKNEALH